MGAHISRIEVKNYRNFIDASVNLSDKTLFVGENGVGKTNIINAIRLILDPNLSDKDRELKESDFNNSIIDPFANGVEIKISLFIDGYSNTKALMAVLAKGIVNIDNKNYVKITYKYAPVDATNLDLGYTFVIFLGENEANIFGSYERRFFNVVVIKALRDVDADFNSKKRSPINSIISKYGLSDSSSAVKDILDQINNENKKILGIEEIADANKVLETIINPGLSRYKGTKVNIGLSDEKSIKILNQLKLLQNGTDLSESSLGLCNVIYILMALAAINKKNEMTFISSKVFLKFSPEESSLITKYYKATASGNYILIDIAIEEPDRTNIIDILQTYDYGMNSVSIVIVEEPEAHLHPSFIRMIYKDVFRDSISVIFTTHSPHLASICPLEYIAHLHNKNNSGSKITSCSDICKNCLSETEIKKIEQFIDINRADIFFGRGVIMVEGTAEEIILPQYASLLNIELDSYGIIVCNILNCYFYYYALVLSNLEIPFVIITDGDPNYSENGEKRAKDLLNKFGIDIIARGEPFEKYRIFIGKATLEIDILNLIENNDAICNDANHSSHGSLLETIISECYDKTTIGKEEDKQNFRLDLKTRDYDKCLQKIVKNSKPRFIQELSCDSRLNAKHIPLYIEKAIIQIIDEVK